MQASPPSNAAYMVAAYVVTAVIIGAYAVSLWRRARQALRSGGDHPEGAGGG